jgi:hypothetical protein
MATTTPNYGWAVPTSTDLVKDGATAIETLGDAIDASMNTALGTKKAGMVLLNTTSFSAVSSQSINDVFSTTYDDYRIIIVASSATAGTDLTLRVRVSGSDLSTGTYTYNRIIGDGGTLNSARSSAQTSIRCGNTTLSEETSYIIDVVNPFLTKRTVFTINNSNQGGGAAQDMTAAVVTNATSYTGFTILAGNNLTGRLSVYGYNK